jgi:hypothetical protein
MMAQSRTPLSAPITSKYEEFATVLCENRESLRFVNVPKCFILLSIRQNTDDDVGNQQDATRYKQPTRCNKM